MPLKIIPGAIVAGKSGTPLEVVAIDSEAVTVRTSAGTARAKRSAILRVISSPPFTGQTFHLGDRVTMLDKFMVRAADVGTVEAITQDGIRILWDNNSPHEPHLKQPPVLFRTFPAAELELIKPSHSQN
jgi:hypothetical protein